MGKELFERIDRKVGDLLNDIRIGKIGLPDLQRPFVWKDNKVRDLLDSMKKGYPVGYVMLWKAPEEFDNVRSIGTNSKDFKAPQDLVIDGQQRLTSLLGAMYGVEVKDKNYKSKFINISFNPLTNEFQVWTQAYENDKRWISKISKIFEAESSHTFPSFRKSIFKQINEVREKNGESILTDDEETTIEENLTAVLSLQDYTIPTLQITSKAEEEDVADIFKRVNSGGQNLTENNFIETLLSVYDNEMHDDIYKFCEDSRIAKDGTSYNQIINVDSSHLIRMAVGYGFRRARLAYAYKLLRGKDLETGVTSEETRKTNLLRFKDAMKCVMNLNDWHCYLNIFADSGYLKGDLISSKNVVVYSYVLFLIGKHDFRISVVDLRKVIARWIFMTTITSYFVEGSPESIAERIFADIRNMTKQEEFLAYLNDAVTLRLSDDFFTLELPNNLKTSSSTSPFWYGYIASLNILGYPMLFSKSPLAKYWIVGSSGKKSAIDKHHIFPKHYLTEIGIEDDRDRNQIANFTYLDYNTNIDIADKEPPLYVSIYRSKLGEEGYKTTCRQNALPENFETMDYFDFLEKRRVLMAGIIKKAYEQLLDK